MSLVNGNDEMARRTVGGAATVREVFDTMPVLMAALEGPDHTLVASNDAYRAFIGRSSFIGLPVREVFPDLAGQQLFELLDRVYETGEAVAASGWRIQLEEPQGEIYLDFSLTPWRTAQGAVRGILVTQADATERIREQLRERAAFEERERRAEERYEAARDVIITLQRELLPRGVPVLPELRIAARYLVAAESQAAGGDWFDVVLLSGGRVALVVGDVVGHGVTASATMGQLRAVVSHELRNAPDLHHAVDRFSSFAAGEPALRAATVAVAVLDPATGRLQYVTCGHPPPLVLDETGAARFLPTTGTGPLATGSQVVVAHEHLGPGATLLLYTDGLIERPGQRPDDAIRDLASVAGDAAANRAMPVGAPASAPDRVCQLTVELLTRSGYSDDVTTLAAQRLAEPVPTLALDLVGTEALAGTRRALEAWLGDLGVSGHDSQMLQLALSEAITNAIEHAYPANRPGPVHIRAAVNQEGYLEASVSDEGRWRTPSDPAPPDRGRGLLLATLLVDEVLVAQGEISGEIGGGTTVSFRHRLYRPGVVATDATAVSTRQMTAQAFATRVVSDGGGHCVDVEGPIDSETSVDLERVLLRMSRGGVVALTVNLSAATMVASAGVRVLYDVRRQLEAHGNELTLVAPSGTIAATVLDLVGLPRVPQHPGTTRQIGPHPANWTDK